MLKVQELNVFSYERNRSVFHLPFFFFFQRSAWVLEKEMCLLYMWDFFRCFAQDYIKTLLVVKNEEY